MEPRAGKKSTIDSSLGSLKETIQSISVPEFQNTSVKSILDEEPEASPPVDLQIPVQIPPQPNFQSNSFGLIDDGTGMNINQNSNIMVSLGSQDVRSVLKNARTQTFNDRAPDPDVQISEFPLVDASEGGLNETPFFKKESLGIGEVEVDRGQRVKKYKRKSLFERSRKNNKIIPIRRQRSEQKIGFRKEGSISISPGDPPGDAGLGQVKYPSQVLSKKFLEKVEEGGDDSENGSPGKNNGHGS